MEDISRYIGLHAAKSSGFLSEAVPEINHGLTKTQLYLCIMSNEWELSSALLEDINPVLDKFARMKNRCANLLKT